VKKCPACQTDCEDSTARCQVCGFVFPAAPNGDPNQPGNLLGRLQVEALPAINLGPLNTLNKIAVVVTFDGTEYKMKTGDKKVFNLTAGNHAVELCQRNWLHTFARCGTTVSVQPGQTVCLRYKGGMTIFSNGTIEVSTK